MTRKSVPIGAKPTVATAPATADEWVSTRTAPTEPKAEGEPMKRLTIDVPESLHRRIKTDCAARGVKMADEIRELLEEKFKAG